jgi:hypothetical protein
MGGPFHFVHDESAMTAFFVQSSAYKVLLFFVCKLVHYFAQIALLFLSFCSPHLAVLYRVPPRPGYW